MANAGGEDRSEAVSEALSDVLKDGDDFRVSCAEGRVRVVPELAGLAKAGHPELHGYLLGLNEQIKESGSGLNLWAMLATAIFCLGVHLQWWNGALGDGVVESLRSIWFYIVALVTTLLIVGQIDLWIERRCYRFNRLDMQDQMEKAGVSRELLLSMVEGDPGLAKVSEYVKLDWELRPDLSRRDR